MPPSNQNPSKMFKFINDFPSSSLRSSYHLREKTNDFFFRDFLSESINLNPRNDIGEETDIQEIPSFVRIPQQNNEIEKVKEKMERILIIGKPFKSGQASLEFKYDVSKALMVAEKTYNRDNMVKNREGYQRELNIYKIAARLPFVARLISQEDENLILNIDKGFCDLKYFLFFCRQQRFLREDQQIKRFIFQVAYGLSNIIKIFILNGILHGDIKPNNIILNPNPIVGKNYLIVQIIDFGYSIVFDPRHPENSDSMICNGFTSYYHNRSLLECKNRASEYWCLGNTILKIIEMLSGMKDLQCKDLTYFNGTIKPKLVSKKYSEIIKILEILFSENVLFRINELNDYLQMEISTVFGINIKNLYNEEHGFLIDIQNLPRIADEICELNPLLANLKESTTEKVYQKAFRFINVKPSSEKKKYEGKMLFFKCLTSRDISPECISKCLFHLGNSFHLAMRKYQLCTKILSASNCDSFSKMFPKDFKTKKTKFNMRIFVKKINDFGVKKILKKFARTALKIQNQISTEESVVKARYFDLASLVYEYKQNYKKAFSFQKKHASIWFNSARIPNMNIEGDINYSKGQLLKYASFFQLKGNDRIYINRLFNTMNRNDEPENAWTKHAKVYHSIFLLKSENKKQMRNGHNMAKEVFEKLISRIEKNKFVSHPDVYDIVDLLVSVFEYEDKFGISKQFSIKNNIRKNPLFSLLNFEVDKQVFFEECSRVYEGLKDRLEEKLFF